MNINGKNIEVAAVDFDGTLFTEDAYPLVGKPIDKNISYVQYLQDEGVQLILWTCREGEDLKRAIEACEAQGIKFDAVNSNLEWRTAMYGNDCRKVGADIYIDDKSLNLDRSSEWVTDRYQIVTCKSCGKEAYSRGPSGSFCMTTYIRSTYCPHCGNYMLNGEE